MTRISISKRFIDSGIWLFALRICQNFLVLLKLVFVARLLSPESYGLFGIALLTVVLIETFSQTGLESGPIDIEFANVVAMASNVAPDGA